MKKIKILGMEATVLQEIKVILTLDSQRQNELKQIIINMYRNGFRILQKKKK
jgi:hypothetical protein